MSSLNATYDDLALNSDAGLSTLRIPPTSIMAIVDNGENREVWIDMDHAPFAGPITVLNTTADILNKIQRALAGTLPLEFTRFTNNAGANVIVNTQFVALYFNNLGVTIDIHLSGGQAAYNTNRVQLNPATYSLNDVRQKLLNPSL